MRIKLWMLVLSCLCLSVSFQSAEFWLKKPYTKWSQQECRDLLMKSPWSFVYTDTNIYEPATNASAGTGGRLPPGQQRASQEPQTGEREIYLHFHFTLLTAKPIRMAHGQLTLLKAPEAKDQVERMINVPAGKEIVVQLSYSSEPPGISQIHDIQGFFLRASLADFQGRTTMASSDKTVPVSTYVQPNDRSSYPLLIFPRLDENGQPYFNGKEKSILLRCECSIPIASKGTAVPSRMTVKVEPKKMFFENEFCL